MVFCNVFNGQLEDFNLKRHNPYFNRWFSAINFIEYNGKLNDVTILILIDGFLQF